MSYSIVFQTILVKYDNKILWFDRSGCNNDDCGRKSNDFRLEIFESENDYINYFSKWLGNNNDGAKINNKWLSLDGYAKYYLSKLKRVLSVEDFNNRYYNSFIKIKNIIIGDEIIPIKDFDFWKEYEKRGGCFTYRKDKEKISLDDLVQDKDNVIIDIVRRKYPLQSI